MFMDYRNFTFYLLIHNNIPRLKDFDVIIRILLGRITHNFDIGGLFDFTTGCFGAKSMKIFFPVIFTKFKCCIN